MMAHRLRYWPNIRPIRFNASRLLLRRLEVGQCYIILAYNLTTITFKLYTLIHYFIILDGVSRGELIPLHLPSFCAFIRPLKKYE